MRNRIIHINPISSDLLGIRARKGLYTRIVRKLRSFLKFFRQVNPNLYVLSPVFLPFQGNPVLDRINNIILKTQLTTVMFLLRMKKPLLWIDNVRAADFIKNFSWQLIVYHASDCFEECPYTNNKAKLKEREAYVSNNSDVIICVSKKLYEAKQNVKAKVHYLPHGVDFEFFRKAVEDHQTFDRIFQRSRFIAGYFGTLTAQNDIELLEYCAVNLPNVYFVFAGQITAGDYGKLSKMPNVIFLGRVPYKKIASLCATFDVCLLPWKMNKWIANCNPLKLFEYMASGKPIVSVPICEIVDKYSGIVSLAETKEEYCNAIVWELNNDTDERRCLRIETARKHSWDNHIQRLSHIISNAISAKNAELTKFRYAHSIRAFK